MEDEKEIDLTELLKSILKRWKMITCLTLLCTIISASLSFFVITPKYEVSTKLFIGKEAADTKDQNYSNSDVTMYQNLLKTYAQLVKTEDLVNTAITKKNIDMSSKDVLKSLEVTPSDDTQILEIKYVASDKYMAKNVVESVTDEFVSKAQSLIPNGKVEIVESAKIPEKPISPNKIKNIVIGVALGLILGIGLAVLLEFTNNTFKTKEDLEKILGVPVIGTIPDEAKIK